MNEKIQMTEKIKKAKMEEKALSFLEKDWLLNIGMIEVIRRGTAVIYYATEEGVFLKESVSEAYMISATNIALGKEWLDELEEGELFQICQLELAEYAKERFHLEEVLNCTQVVYTKKEKIAFESELEFRVPREEEYPIIRENYYQLTDEELRRIIEFGNLFVGVLDGKVVGFIGNHLEGSTGLLEVLPEYRKCGYGTDLECFMINHDLENGKVPFGQVVDGNDKSFGLQKKLGMEQSKGKVFWIY